MSAEAEAQHLPAQQSWDCLDCGKPWPCGPARERLLAEYKDPTALRIYLWLCIEEAAEQLPAMTVTEAIDRFLDWA